VALNTEAKRWSMLAMASNPVRTHVFNPATSGLVSIEKITVLQYYGGISWDSPVAVTGDGKIGGLSAGLYGATGAVIRLGRLGKP